MFDAHALPSNVPFPVRALLASRDSCRGVAIDVDASQNAPVYSVLLLTEDATHARRVAATRDERAARRMWCLLAKSLRVPRLVAEVEGGFRQIDRVMGHVVGRPPQARRGRRVPLRRRHSSRQHSCAKQAAPAVHAGEREIVCYE